MINIEVLKFIYTPSPFFLVHERKFQGYFPYGKGANGAFIHLNQTS